MKPLYLTGGRHLRVLLDGPALRVRVIGEADRLFPLKRLSHVVVIGDSEWDTGALLACADREVPVNFINAQGGLRARMCGRHRAQPVFDLAQGLQAMCELDEGPSHLETWFDAKAQHARIRLMRRIYGGAPSPSAASLHRAVRTRALHLVDDHNLDLLDRTLSAIMSSHVERLLGAVGIDPDADYLAARRLDLVRACVDILIWDIQISKLRFLFRWSRSHPRPDKPRMAKRTAVSFYEGQSATVAGALREVLATLHVYLLEYMGPHAG